MCKIVYQHPVTNVFEKGHDIVEGNSRVSWKEKNQKKELVMEYEEKENDGPNKNDPLLE